MSLDGDIWVLSRTEPHEEPAILADQGWFGSQEAAERRCDELNGITEADYARYVDQHEAAHGGRLALRAEWEACQAAGVRGGFWFEPPVPAWREPDSFGSWRADQRRVRATWVVTRRLSPAKATAGV